LALAGSINVEGGGLAPGLYPVAGGTDDAVARAGNGGRPGVRDFLFLIGMLFVPETGCTAGLLYSAGRPRDLDLIYSNFINSQLV